MSFRWYGDKFIKKVGRRLSSRNVKEAALYLEGVIKKSFPAGPSRATSSKERPHQQSGDLLMGITSEPLAEFTWGVGSRLLPPPGDNWSYALMLELGTSKMKGGRPYLRPALDENRRRLVRILSQRI